MTTIIVRAAAGLRVPVWDVPRRHITDDKPVAVPDNAYYRRRIADGDLVVVPDEAAASKPAPEKPKEE